jgi:hypothetical protein
MNESDGRSQDAQSWKRLYKTAVLETNEELGPQRVLEVRKAAGERALHLTSVPRRGITLVTVSFLGGLPHSRDVRNSALYLRV